MADQSDVEQALATLIVGVVYPDGAEAGSAVGATCRVYRGWPNAAALDADLAAGRVNVTVFPDTAGGSNSTRWPDEYTDLAAVTPALSVLVEGNAATIFGTADTGQLVGLMVDTQAVVHRTAVGDTPELVAAILAEAIRNPSDGRGRPVQVSGATLSVPGAGFMLGRVVADQPSLHETRRQLQPVRISAWCPTAALRDSLCALLDTALSGKSFIDLPDGSAGRLRYVSTTVFDQSVNARLYRRDLVYSVDYATTIAESLPSMLFGTVTVAADGGPVVASRTS